MTSKLPSNTDIAELLDRVADLLGVQAAESYRVQAYRHAAQSVRDATAEVASVALDEPAEAIERLPGIGASIGSAIREYAASGRLRMLERLEGQVSPEDLFSSVPGIGEELARRIHTHLGAETLEELELAAHNGQLERVPGFGPRRAEAVREILAGLLSRSGRRRSRLVDRQLGRHGDWQAEAERPRVDLILRIDLEYRERSDAGELRTITPRRFNPEHRAWLPILHRELDGWTFTALFSNTARAHELQMTRDWVIVYYERDGDEGQATVVTERHGRMMGARVVRGREVECLAHYGLS